MTEEIVTVMRSHQSAGEAELEAQRGASDEARAAFTGIPERTCITGITIAIAGIFAFFVGILSAYIIRHGSPAEDWRNLPVPRVLWLNTAILVSSSVTLSHSRKRFAAGDRSGFTHWWTVTGILGILFLAGQLISWRQLSSAAIYLSTNPSSSFFYLLTAAHGAYVLGGIAALFFLAARPPQRVSLDTTGKLISIYWHFMTCTWICLFLVFLIDQ
jgi:cytochrome c oxidase subunit III